MKRFGINWNRCDKINDVVIYESEMSKQEFEKFRQKKGYEIMKVGRGEVQVAPMHHTFTSRKVSIYYTDKKLVLAVNTKG